MIEFEPTEWKVPLCKECKTTLYSHFCKTKKHTKIEIQNVPFLAPDMMILEVRKWITLYSKRRNKEYQMSGSKFEKVIINCGIKPGGLIPDQWWMFAKVGGVLTLKWLGLNDNN